MSYRIQITDEYKVEKETFYVNIFISDVGKEDKVEYILKTGNENIHSDTVDGIKSLFAEYIWERPKDIFLLRKINDYYLPVTENFDITSNMDFYFELRSELIFHVLEKYKIYKHGLLFDFLYFREQFGDRAEEILIDIFRKKLPIIIEIFDELKIVVKNFDSTMFLELLRALNMCNLQNMKKFYLIDNKFDDILEIAHVLYNSPSLVVLKMIGMEYTEQQIEKLMYCLRRYNKSLKTLMLNRCNVTDDSIKYISTLYETLPTDHVYLGKKMPKEILGMINSYKRDLNIHIRELYLNRNEIGDRGIKEIAKSLIHNDSLKILDLQGNMITSEGVVSFIRQLTGKTYKKLNILNLLDNRINEQDRNELKTAIKDTVELTYFA